MSGEGRLLPPAPSPEPSSSNPFLDRASSTSPSPPPVNRKPVRVPTNTTLYTASSVRPTSNRNSFYSQAPPSYRPAESPPRQFSPISEFNEIPSASQYNANLNSRQTPSPNEVERAEQRPQQQSASLRRTATLPGGRRRRMRATCVLPVIALLVGVIVLIGIIVALKVSKAGQRN